MVKLFSWSRLTTLAAAAGAYLAGYGPLPAAAQQSVTMKLAAVTVNDPVHLSMSEYQKRLDSRTAGRIKAEVYPASQLGAITRLIEGLQLGTVEMVVSATTFYGGLHPAFGLGDVPGVFDDLDHAHRTMSDPAFRERYLALGEAKGVRGVSLYVYGGTHYASIAPLHALDDFKGKKVRTLGSKMESEIVARLGATGVPVPFAETVQALQSGTVDAARGNIVVLAGLKYFTVAKSITLLDEAVIPVMAMVSKSFLDKLPADLQAAVIEVGKEIDAWGHQTALEFDQRAAAMWRDNGAQVIRPSDADRAQLQKRLGPVGEEILGANPQTAEMWTLLKSVADKHRRR